MKRPGVSIIEVLFAILITTVGLFGAIAIFPFASAQARRSRVFDQIAVAGRSAVHDFDARGMRRPDMYLAWDEQAAVRAFVSPSSLPAVTVPISGVGTLPVMGNYFCIDPRMIGAHLYYQSSVSRIFNPAQAPNPSNPFQISGNAGGQIVQNFPYLTSDNSFRPDLLRLRRITLRQQGTNPSDPSYFLPMSLEQANSIFMIDDDIAYDRSQSDKTLPASQFATSLGNSAAPANAWGRRQTDGKISWFATLSPKLDISGIASQEYTLSIVMCYERPNDLDIIGIDRERQLDAYWQDPSAATGGEIKIVGASEEDLKLKPNDWIMVSGAKLVYTPPTAAAPSAVAFDHRWYRIVDCDANAGEERDASGNLTGSGLYEVYATLMGQDWSPSFTSTAFPAAAGNAIPVKATIISGAFSVYEKTIRLDFGSSF